MSKETANHCSESQQLEKADQERYELQKRVKALESGSALAAQKVSLALLPALNLVRFNSKYSYEITVLSGKKRKTLVYFNFLSVLCSP